MINNWIFLSIFSAIVFALGDFIVVVSEKEGLNVHMLYSAYMISIGLISLIYILFFQEEGISKVQNLSYRSWLLIIAFSALYFLAYISHLQGIQRAPNPGYSNALVMFHVIILTVLSYVFLNKPLNWKTSVGIFLMFVGAFVITTFSEPDMYQRPGF